MRIITAAEARAFFAAPSQMRHGEIDPADLHDDGLEYWAEDGVCGVFHAALWPGVWMAHYGVMPESWGRTIAPARRILAAFWEAKQPQRIIGWTKESNRAALSFARRLGFEIDGRLDLPSGPVIMQGWRI